MNATLPLLASLDSALVAPEPWRTIGLVITLTFALGLIVAVVFIQRLAARPPHKASALLRTTGELAAPARALPPNV